MPSLSIVSLSKIHAAPTLYEKLDEPGSGLLVFRAFVRGEKKKNFPTRAPFLKLRRVCANRSFDIDTDRASRFEK